MNTYPTAKRMLCYGDSYTWDYIPSTEHKRFPPDFRWTGILQNLLGRKFEIIEEGLNSRTLNSEDERAGKEGRNGNTYLIPCLDTHDPLDIVILMLGTNELKDKYRITYEEISGIVENKYVKVAKTRKSQFSDKKPQLLLISPPILDLTKEYAEQRYSKSAELNFSLAKMYMEIAKTNACLFLDSAEYVKVGSDGVHLDEENHKKLADSIFSILKENLVIE